MSAPEFDRLSRRQAARRRDRRRVLAQRAAALVLLLLAAAATLGATMRGGPRAAPAHRAASPAAHAPAHHAAKLTRRQRALARAVAWARAQRGMHEVGTTNCSPAIDRWERHMGLGVPPVAPCRPWCGAFVYEAYFEGGIKLSSRLIDPNQSYWDAREGVNGLRAIPKDSVRPGDIVFFELDPGVQASHEAIVVAMPRGGRVLTAEGNVGHHAVVTRRGLRYVVLAARVTRKPSRA
jgi:cell wall-associated NlpC family hydrolase